MFCYTLGGFLMARNRVKLGSLVFQIQSNLLSKLRTDHKKYEDRHLGIDTNQYIYSFSTLKTYLRNSCYFADFLKEFYPHIKDINQARHLCDTWLDYRLNVKHDSPSTLKTKRSALAKLFDLKSDDFYTPIPNRTRSIIKRSRDSVPMDKHFSLEKNKSLINFCSCTGVRRHELSGLKGNSLVFIDEKPHLNILRGKGGRPRLAPIIGSPQQVQSVLALLRSTPSSQNVFPSIPVRADIHGYRRVYAQTIYDLHARPISTLSYKDRYYCRTDLKGVCFDRKALIMVSHALGHGRPDKPRPGIAATNYLTPKKEG